MLQKHVITYAKRLHFLGGIVGIMYASKRKYAPSAKDEINQVTVADCSRRSRAT